MTTTQLVIICTTLLAIVTVVTGRKLTVTFRDVKATVEKTNEAVGDKNGHGPVTDMAAQALAELAEIRAEQEDVKRKLEERTHVIRDGHTEPEELAVYTQDRMHDVLHAIQAVGLKVDVLWRFLKSDYDLPDLPSIQHKEKL